MTKSAISAAILEAENTLAKLREKLNEKEKITDFQTGDVFNNSSDVPLVVVERCRTHGNLFFVIGNDNSGTNYLRAYSDCRDGLTRNQMIDYLNEKLDSGWKYVGNIGAAFDEAMRNLIRQK